MSRRKKRKPRTLRWRMECLGHSLIEGLAALLPGPWVFKFGELLGGLAWHLMPQRRRIVLRNLRIAFAGEMKWKEIHRLARESFRRAGANLVSVSSTARLSPAKLRDILHVENMHLLEDAQARGKGVVLLLAHMGNWELLSRIVHLFPPGSKCGAFYRPLNNPLLDARVLARRQADGTRMFSKRDPFHEVTKFLRDGGIVGVLADQRVGMQGEVVSFFGRLTRASPLPSLLARRARAEVLALSLVTEAPGKWKAVFLPVEKPFTIGNCMNTLETSMKLGPTDVFWLQERWKVYAGPHVSFRKWLDDQAACGKKRHRAMLWLIDVEPGWHFPDDWKHRDISYEIAIPGDFDDPEWLGEDMELVVPMFSRNPSVSEIRRYLGSWDGGQMLPLDFILAPSPSKALRRAARRLAIPLIDLP